MFNCRAIAVGTVFCGLIAGCNSSTPARYVVYVQSAEITSAKLDGQPWDGDDSAPDVFCEIWWNNNRIFKSSAVTDSTLPSWTEQEANLREMARSQVLKPRANSGLVTSDGETKVTIRFYDDDLFENDLIGEVSCNIEEGELLVPGTGAIKACRVRVVRDK